MEKYFRKNYIPLKESLQHIEAKSTIEMQIMEWFAKDESSDNLTEDSENGDDTCNEKYIIRCFGVTSEGNSITCKITDFTPFYYVKVPSNFDNSKLRLLIDYIKGTYQMKKKINGESCNYYGNCLLDNKCSIVEKKDLFGFRNNKLYKFVRLVFNNYTALNKSKYIFKNVLNIDGINTIPMKYKLYESNIEPFMRYCHMRDIRMAGWIKLPKGKYKYSSSGDATTQIEISIHWKEIVSFNDKQDIANFLQASWDIETYSFDGSFPDPNKTVKGEGIIGIENIYPNVIYQIATTFKYYKEKDILVKHLLTLKKCDTIPIGKDGVEVVVEECKTEKALIKRWIDLIAKMDPDIFYTYNGDSFDWRYLFKRAELYGLAYCKYSNGNPVKGSCGGYMFEKLTRTSSYSGDILNETFSSSAYGDSDFMRMYLPGRLNYDLLIHYKRGMKKYPSYKLDFISREVLQQKYTLEKCPNTFNSSRQEIYIKPDSIITGNCVLIKEREYLIKDYNKENGIITLYDNYDNYDKGSLGKDIIVTEGKNPVTVKDIFNFYKNGKPKEIATIGRYCLQDTELLQKLVDKQLVLITIIQLANVTFVPIGFLTTRGQTIKVFSQLLRKARQMNYLVPHTNFNEDSYPILIRPKGDDLELDLSDIGKYTRVNCGRNKNSYGKDLVINGKINQIITDPDNIDKIKGFVILSNIELPEPEFFTAKFTYKNVTFQINELSACDELLDTTFTGATVLTATPGFYKDNIAILDFASLYPTIMISRNLCFSMFINDPQFLPEDKTSTGIFKENGITYERFKWDDKIEYTLNHKCQAIGKSGKSKGEICGKPAFFEITPEYTINNMTKDIENLEIELDGLDDKKAISSMKSKIKTREKDLQNFKDLKLSVDKPVYYCRTHDTLKNSRLPEEKFQKKDVSYDYVVVQPHTDAETGEKVNQGVVPAFLEELYSERKKIKKQMKVAMAEGNELLYNILDSTQLAVKVSLNSSYGFLGRKQGNLVLKELGSIVTSVGRSLIEQSKEYAEGPFLDYIKENNTVTQTISFNKDIIESIPDNQKEIILDQFSIFENNTTKNISKNKKSPKQRKINFNKKNILNKESTEPLPIKQNEINNENDILNKVLIESAEPLPIKHKNKIFWQNENSNKITEI
jgi:DNA polymerase elongation subunit (family B)